MLEMKTANTGATLFKKMVKKYAKLNIRGYILWKNKNYLI